jgi:hypothetical protein
MDFSQTYAEKPVRDFNFVQFLVQRRLPSSGLVSAPISGHSSLKNASARLPRLQMNPITQPPKRNSSVVGRSNYGSMVE